jgi:hypothetical protein
MRPALIHTRAFGPLAFALTVTLVAGISGCSGTTEPPPAWATLTLISGDQQTVAMGAETLTDFPQPVVVRLDSLGTPIAGGDLRVAVTMSGAPGANGPYPFTTASDGTASMQLVVSNIPGPVTIDVSYVRCVKPGIFFDCDKEKIFANLLLSAVAVR